MCSKKKISQVRQKNTNFLFVIIARPSGSLAIKTKKMPWSTNWSSGVCFNLKRCDFTPEVIGLNDELLNSYSNNGTRRRLSPTGTLREKKKEPDWKNKTKKKELCPETYSKSEHDNQTEDMSLGGLGAGHSRKRNVLVKVKERSHLGKKRGPWPQNNYPVAQRRVLYRLRLPTKTCLISCK